MLPISYLSFINERYKSEDSSIIIYLKDKDLYLDLEDYIVGVVSAEMPALFEDEALKAQAIAARSFATSKYENNMILLSSTTNDQLYNTNYELYEKWQKDYFKYYNKINSLVKETKDIVIKRDDKILKTYYFSMSNGYTENSSAVFKENTFVSVKSEYENEKLKNFVYEKCFLKNEVLEILGLDSFEINDIKKNSTQHVDKIVIDNKEFSGIELRKLLNLRSTDFDIKIEGENIIFTTRGYGHGVGMSQYGANEMAKNGYNYKEIINHYYINTILDNI